MGGLMSSGCCGALQGLSILGRSGGKDVIVIVGPSGVGKSTLIKRLMHEFTGRFGFSVSHTTRQPRPGEKHEVHYNFTDVETMKAAIAGGQFIEHAEVHGNFYGTSFAAVDKVRASGRICLLDIDVQGAEQMKSSTLNQLAAYLFVAPPSIASLEERLRGRGTESEEKILLRLANAGKEITFAKQNPSFFDGVIVNNDLEKAYMDFRSFMVKHIGKRRLESEDGQGMGSPGWSMRLLMTPRSDQSPRN